MNNPLNPLLGGCRGGCRLSGRGSFPIQQTREAQEGAKWYLGKSQIEDGLRSQVLQAVFPGQGQGLQQDGQSDRVAQRLPIQLGNGEQDAAPEGGEKKQKGGIRISS